MSSPPAGLCDACVHQRVVRNTRGSRFSLCERSRTDPAFPRYPRIPVRECRGFEPRRIRAMGSFRALVEAKDLDGMKAALADDVVFHSPVTFKPFTGRDDVGAVLGVVFELFQDFRYTDEFDNGSVQALVYRARVNDREVEGLDLLRMNDGGEIADFTVMVRPLSAAIALAEGVGPRLEALGVAPA